MHDLILALFFISMTITPAMIAAIVGKETPVAAPVKKTKTRSNRAHREDSKKASYSGTLPVHDTHALAGR